MKSPPQINSEEVLLVSSHQVKMKIMPSMQDIRMPLRVQLQHTKKQPRARLKEKSNVLPQAIIDLKLMEYSL